MLDYVIKAPSKRFIIATESGIIHKMKKACPDKEFIPLPSKNENGIACACNECEYMRMNTLENVYACLRDEQPEMIVDEEIASKAISSIHRMLEMS